MQKNLNNHCTNLHAYIHTYIHTYSTISACADSTFLPMHTYINTLNAYICTYVYIHTYKPHTYVPLMHTYIHTYMQTIDSTFLPTTFEIHWLSVVNSFVLVLLLTFFLAVILMRILKNDFSKYMEIDEEELTEEVGIYCFCTVCMYVMCIL